MATGALKPNSLPLRSMLLTLLALVMISCGSPPPGQEIPFTTVIKFGNPDIGTYPKSDPNIVVTAEPAEIKKELKPLLFPGERNAVQDIDLSTYFLIAAFQGHKPSGGYEIEIISVRQGIGYRINVIAQFVSPAPRTPVTLAERSPYHVIKVKKADLPRKGRLIFYLMDTSGRVVTRTIQEVL